MRRIVRILVVLCMVALMPAMVAQEFQTMVRVTNDTGQAITVTSDDSINLEAGKTGEVKMKRPPSPAAGSEVVVKTADGQSVTTPTPGSWQRIMPPYEQGPTGVMNHKDGFVFPFAASIKDGKLKVDMIWLPAGCDYGQTKLSVTNNTDKDISVKLQGWVPKTVAAGKNLEWNTRGSTAEFIVTAGEQQVSKMVPASKEALTVGAQAPSGLMRVSGTKFVFPYAVSMTDGKLTVEVVRK